MCWNKTQQDVGDREFLEKCEQGQSTYVDQSARKGGNSKAIIIINMMASSKRESLLNINPLCIDWHFWIRKNQDYIYGIWEQKIFNT